MVSDLGAAVGGTESDPAVPEAVAGDICEAGGEATADYGDISDFDYAKQLVAETVAEHECCVSDDGEHDSKPTPHWDGK